MDGDDEGDACDNDIDGDNFVNGLDNCPQNPNPDQTDTDGDGIGDACDAPPDAGVTDMGVDMTAVPDMAAVDMVVPDMAVPDMDTMQFEPPMPAGEPSECAARPAGGRGTPLFFSLLGGLMLLCTRRRRAYRWVTLPALFVLFSAHSASAQVDLNEPQQGADLLEFDVGELFVVQPQQNCPSCGPIMPNLDAVFPPIGPQVGPNHQTRWGLGLLGGVAFEVHSGIADLEDVDFASGEPIDERFLSLFHRYWAVMEGAVSGFGVEHRANIDVSWRSIPPAEDTPGRLVLTWRNVPMGLARYADVEAIDAFNAFQMIWTQASFTDPAAASGDTNVELRYRRCNWHFNPRGDSYVGAGIQNAVFSADLSPRDFDYHQPRWIFNGSFSSGIKKLCVLSNVNERGVWRYEVRDGVVHGCGLGPAFDPMAAGEPGSPCTDDNNDPGDGCSPDCLVELDDDGDGLYESPHPDDPDPLGAYDSCVATEPGADCGVDGDDIPDQDDNCPAVFNPFQRDRDGDGMGDLCDDDLDGDGLRNDEDPCVRDADWILHPDSQWYDDPRLDEQFKFDFQANNDGDAFGDICDDDDDNDGVLDCGNDLICPYFADGVDNNGDTVADDNEVTPAGPFPDDTVRSTHDRFDNDSDGRIDEADEAQAAVARWLGRDADGSEDNCRQIANPDQANADGDVYGDACDEDADDDGVLNCGADGLCDPTRDFRDNDSDGLFDEAGECVDPACPTIADRLDNDGDGLIDESPDPQDGLIATLSTERDLDPTPWPGPDADGSEDNCVLVSNPDQADTDGDGLGDACDDDDGDGFALTDDNCPETPNPEQLDNDGDGNGDACDDDDDDDTVPDGDDNCPFLANLDQADLNGDDEGDVCDDDDDGDGVPDADDNCPEHVNGTLDADGRQADLDGDGLGDLCDPDADDDGLDNRVDNCPLLASENQDDLDGDDIGDLCDDDIDGDEVLNAVDNCPRVANPDQLNTDAELENGDEEGDVCDDDDDGDGAPDPDNPLLPNDNCPLTPNPDQADRDSDGQGDVCDNDRDGDDLPNAADLCPDRPQREFDDDTADLDGDGIGDPCDGDVDGDEVPNGDDNCRRVPNPDQENVDNDAAGDACDDNSDDDSIPDAEDNCDLVTNEDQRNNDDDDEGDACDDDDDNDGVPDEDDNCRLVANPDQNNFNGDASGDACQDTDGDGHSDDVDNCPSDRDPSQADRNMNGVGDICDDPDDDEVFDDVDNCPDVPNPDQRDQDRDGTGDVCEDSDDDGIIDSEDNCPNAANPDQTDTNDNGIGDACDDSDQDGHVDAVDNCPLDVNRRQLDRNMNGVGDVCDDPDGDAVFDDVDNCPDVINPDQKDRDSDGIGDVCDDSDRDGVFDNEDNCPTVANAEQTDTNDNGVGDACDDTVMPGDRERCLIETPLLLQAQRCGESKRIGCVATPGQSDGAAWWLLAGSMALRRRRKVG